MLHVYIYVSFDCSVKLKHFAKFTDMTDALAGRMIVCVCP